MITKFKDSIIKDIILNDKTLKNHQKIETGVLYFDNIKTTVLYFNNITLIYGYDYEQKCFFVQLDEYNHESKKTNYFKIVNNNVLKLANRIINKLIQNKTIVFIDNLKNQSNRKFKFYKGYTKENEYFSIDIYNKPIENLFIGLGYKYCSTLLPRKINKFFNENFKKYY